jgi:tRNA dimethylallyltransferase
MALAEATGGAIVNADSVQLYRGLPILTAQPSAVDRARLPHRLYGILADDASSSVADWLALATTAIVEAQPRLAIVTGGTGFYLEALLRGLPTVPATPAELRERSRARLDLLGSDAFAAELARLDPTLAAAGLPRDRQRRLRAWEVATLTGRSILDWQRTPPVPPDLPPFRGGLALVPPREVVWQRVERRARAMLAAGAVDELKLWRARPAAWRSPLAKADGVVELGRYLDDEIDLETALAQTVFKVRRYAKRQRTWLRHRLPELAPTAEVGEAVAARLLPVDS